MSLDRMYAGVDVAFGVFCSSPVDDRGKKVGTIVEGGTSRRYNSHEKACSAKLTASIASIVSFSLPSIFACFYISAASTSI